MSFKILYGNGAPHIAEVGWQPGGSIYLDLKAPAGAPHVWIATISGEAVKTSTGWQYPVRWVLQTKSPSNRRR